MSGGLPYNVNRDDEPGGCEAVRCGCTCPRDQPLAAEAQYLTDKGCPLHGLGMVKALVEGEAEG